MKSFKLIIYGLLIVAAFYLTVGAMILISYWMVIPGVIFIMLLAWFRDDLFGAENFK